MAQAMPFMNGHGSTLIRNDIGETCSGTATDYATLLHPISPAVTGNNPEYLFIHNCVNDAGGGSSPATIEASMQSIWQQAHTDGWIVVQSDIYPYTGQSFHPEYATNKYLVNSWAWLQGKNYVSVPTGQYWDQYLNLIQVVPNLAYSSTGSGFSTVTGPGAIWNMANYVNQTLSTQDSSVMTQTPYFWCIATDGCVFMPPTSNNAFAIYPGNGVPESTTPTFLIDTSNGLMHVSGGTGAGSKVADFYNPSTASGHSTWIETGKGGNPGIADFGYQDNGGSTDEAYMSVNNGTEFDVTTRGNPVGFSSAPSGTCPTANEFQFVGSGQIWYCPSASGTWTQFAGGGGGLNGAVTYTSSQTASSSDNGKLVIMNCSSACVYTLPAVQPSTTWQIAIQTAGTTNATIALGGSDTYNGSTSVPLLNQYRTIGLWANTATSTDYRGDVPLSVTSPIVATLSSNGLNLSCPSCGGSSGPSDTTVTVSSGTQGANSCSSTTNVTMSGLTTSMVVFAGYSASTSGLTGWGSTGGMVFQIWPSSTNTATWWVCNQTASSITYSAITFNVGAK